MSYQCNKCGKNILSVVPWLCTCGKSYHPRCIRPLSKTNPTYCCTQQFIVYEATLTPTTRESLDNLIDLNPQVNQLSNQQNTTQPQPKAPDVISFPPQWSASSTDDKLTFLATIFLNHVNNNNHENRVLQQTVSANTSNIATNTTNIQYNTSEIKALKLETAESDKKHELVISGIPSIINQQLDLTVKAIFDSIGASRFLNFICKIRLFKTNNSNPQNQQSINTPSGSTTQTIPPNSTYSLAVRVSSRDVLDTIIELKRGNKELKCSVVFSNQTLPGLIYINEILPPHKYQLYKRTRTFAK